MICRQILTQLTLTDAAFVCPGAFTGFEYIFTHWNKRRTYETHQQLSLGLVYTHSLWKKLNCYLDMYTLLVIGGIELNPGPARNEYSKHISIAHVNINSITAIGKLQELENFVDVNQISILSLTETKLDDTVSPSLYTIDNFHPPLTKHRDRHGGGTAIYIHKSLTFSRIPSLELPGEEWIWVKIKVNNITFIICSIYLPPHPAAQRQEEFIDRLTDSVTRAQLYSPNVLLTGDLNVGNLFLPPHTYQHSGVTAFDRRVRDMTTTLDLTQLITQPTRIENDTHNLRDLCFTSNTDLIICSGLLSSFSTLDHFPIFATLSIINDRNDDHNVTEYWDYSNMDADRLTQLLLRTDWNSILSKDIDEAITDFTACIMDAARQCIPTKRTRQRHDKPWVTSELLKQIRKRERLFNTARKRKTDKQSWARWRTQRNLVTNFNRQLYDEHIKNKVSLLLQHKHDPYKYHKILKDLTGRNKNHTIPTLIQQDGTTATEDTDKAEMFNNHFAAQTRLDINNIQIAQLQDYRTTTTEPVPTLSDIDISPGEVLNALNNMDANKSCGSDKLPTKILKLTALLIYEPLTQLFNKSLASGKYPTSWKNAKVRPIFKRKGTPSEVNNYRPISLLPCLSKVFGKIIFSHIYQHITESSLLSDRQSGYRPGHNTQLQLTYLTDKLYNSLDKGQDFTTVYLDITRYFEKIWHAGLLAICEKEFGLTGNLLTWLESYLTDRRQTVNINNATSQPLTLDAGVPQGSVLGPLLAILYLNGLCDKTTNNMLFYADDCSLFSTYSQTDNFRDVQLTLQQDLDIIYHYGKTWAITFNATKTTQQTFSHRQQTNIPALTFGGQPIPTVDDHKHLGLTLSTDLRFHNHVNDILLKFNRSLDPLYPLARHIPKSTLLSIYTTYVQPFLDYCDTIYDGHITVTDCMRLERAQNRAARLITGTALRTSTDGLRRELGWTKLTDRRKMHKLQLYHKLVFDPKVPAFIKSTIPNTRQQSTPRILRNASAKSLPIARTTTYYKSFIPSSTRIWNTLPETVRTNSNNATFKKYLVELIVPPCPPLYFFQGTKTGNLLHTKLRLNVSRLNAHLFSLQKTDSPSCFCGHFSENTKHFLLTCPLHHAQRAVLYHSLSLALNTDFSIIPPSEQFDILINGKELSRGVDDVVATAVQQFLIQTHRL